MRKFLRVCFIVALCLVFTACGASEGDSMASDIIVHMEVNPSFDIHVNNDGTIKNVDCLNEDAQTVYAEMDLIGVVYEDGFEQLLTEIHEAGFLREDAKIIVEIKKKDTVTYDVSAVTDMVLAEFEENVQPVESEVKSEVVKKEETLPNMGVTGMDDAQVQAQQTCTWCLQMDIDDDAQSDMYIYLDENQTITYVSCENDKAKEIEENADVIGQHIKNGLVALWDAGFALGYCGGDKYISVSVLEEPEPFSLFIQLGNWAAEYSWETQNYIPFSVGFIDGMELYENFRAQFSGEDIRISKNGTVLCKETRRYENGVLKSKISEYSDSLYEEFEYNEDGIPSYLFQKDKYGITHEYWYDSNGTATSYYETRPDGTTVEHKHDSNGRVIYLHQVNPDGTIVIHNYGYDEDGNRVILEDE